jgi:hypothetical protein
MHGARLQRKPLRQRGLARTDSAGYRNDETQLW